MSSYRYTYSDCSGNSYKIGDLSITFEPIMPTKNADGFYTDGEPLTIAITSEQRAELVEMFDQAFSNRTFRLEKRTFDSSEIRKIAIDEDSEKDIKKVILALRSPDKQKIDALLKELLS